MKKKYKLKKYPHGGEHKDLINSGQTDVKVSPVIISPKSPEDALKMFKWNKFQSFLNTQRLEDNSSLVGNTALDKKVQKGLSASKIEEWNKLNPKDKITDADIIAAQKYAELPDQSGWLGSQTSQVRYNIPGYQSYKITQPDGTFQFTFGPRGTKPEDPTFPLANEQEYKNIKQFGIIPESYKKQFNIINAATTAAAPKFPQGGKVGNFFQNFGTAIADNALSLVGANDVLNQADYRGENADKWGKFTDAYGKIVSTAAPIIATGLGGPMAGQAVKMGQNIIGGQLNQQFGPQQVDPITGQLLNYPAFQMGGINYNNPNAELEKKEVMKFPNGTTGQVNGPAHNNGGVQVNIPDGTKIFSDRLKTKDKQTFAKAAEAYKTTKEEKVLADEKADKLKKMTAGLMMEAKNRRLEELFAEQEELKISNFTNDLFNYGGTMKKMKDGGIFIKPENRGKFTAAAKRAGMGVQEYASKILADKENYSNTLVKRANFAKNAAGWKHPHGGIHNSFVQEPNNAWMQWQSQNWDPEKENYEQAFQRFQGTLENPTGFNPNQFTPLNVPDAITTNQEVNALRMPGTEGNKFQMSNTGKDVLGYGLGFAAQNLGNLAYLKEQGKRYDTQQRYDYKPVFLSDKEALRQADTEGNVAAQNIRSASGGNAGTYLSNRVALGSTLAKAKAGISENFANQNAQIANQGEMFNIGNKYAVDDVNARNKAAALNQYYKTLGAVGQGGAGAYKDFKATQMDRSKISMLPQLFEVFKNNPEMMKLLQSWGK